MAKFPTEVERSVTVRVDPTRVYEYLWDVVGSSACVPGLASCKRVGKNTYRFCYRERSAGPVSLAVRYTARYEGNGKDRIAFATAPGADDNAEVAGTITLQPTGSGSTRIVLRQMVAPETPIPRLLQGLIKSFVEKEAAEGVRQYLANVKRALEGQSPD